MYAREWEMSDEQLEKLRAAIKELKVRGQPKRIHRDAPSTPASNTTSQPHSPPPLAVPSPEGRARGD